MDYKQLQRIKEQYNNTDTIQLKRNVRTIMKQYNISFDLLAEIMGISLNTTYSYGKKNSKNKPDLYNLLILASYLNITIDQFFTNNSD